MTDVLAFRRRDRALIVLAALATAISLSGLLTLTASADAASAGPKPTVVLVHGAWADASGWNDVIDRLQKDGYAVLAPANPLRSLTSDSAYIASVLDTVTGPIVLVGHSYGGAVITNAAVNHPGVVALVYVSAFIPDEGDDLFTLVGRFPGSEIVPPGLPGATLVGRPYPLTGGGTGTDLYIDTANFRRIFAADLPSKTTAEMAATQRPLADVTFSEKSGVPAWKTLPSWAVVGTADNAIGTANVRAMAQNAGAQITEVNASHVVMISQPKVVADVIEAAAAATAKK